MTRLPSPSESSRRAAVGRRTALVATATLAVAPLSPATAQQPSGEQAVRGLLGRWFAAWSPGGEPWSGEGLRGVFAPGTGSIAVVDDMGGRVVTFSGVDDYLRFWRDWMAANVAEWRIRPRGEPEVTASGDLAVAAFAYDADGRTTAGQALRLAPAQYGTHVYRRFGGELGWRLVREHLTTAK